MSRGNDRGNGNAGKIYTHTEPSKKALKHIRSEIKQLTTKRYSATPTEVVMRLKDWQDYHGNACHIEGS